MASLEEKVEDSFKAQLDSLGVRRYGKTEAINPEIKAALDQAESKSGGSGGNYPDIQAYLDNGHVRRIPVMMECKGAKGKLEKFDKEGRLSSSQKDIQAFAVNGAVHYGIALLDGIEDLNEVVAIGMNGTKLDSDGNVTDLTCKAYYLSDANGFMPVHIPELDDDLSLLAEESIDYFYTKLDDLLLSEEEREREKRKTEEQLEAAIQKIHQRLYDDKDIKLVLETNQKLYLLSGLIMAGLSTKGLATLRITDLHGNNSPDDNDGVVILNRIKAFLNNKECDSHKTDMVIGLLRPVFTNDKLWKPKNGVSILRNLYQQVSEEIVPLLESRLHLDFMGKIFNNLSDWVHIENDKANDVVLTPRYVTMLMAKLCQTDMDSMVWDTAMGTGGFLTSAMGLMIDDARRKIKGKTKLEEKINHIKRNQLLGIEILDNIFILAVLNMILMGDGSSNLYREDSHEFNEDFPASVFLLNPPYSAPGKGLIFVEEALAKMEKGYGAVLIQENAGSGQGDSYPKEILKKNTLLASIHMPNDLFSGKSSVQTAIYLFKANQPHDLDHLVKFFDFSNDGYARQNRKKSTQKVNLRDVDDAQGRYAELVARVLGKKTNTAYYTQENGQYIEDTISLNGNDWTFSQHQVIDTVPTEADFKATVAEYLSWKVGTIMKEGVVR